MYPLKLQRNTLIIALIVIACWTFFGLFFGSQTFFRNVYQNRPADLSSNLFNWLICGYSWAFVTLPVLFWLRRFSLERLGIFKFLGVQLPAAAVFPTLALAVYALLSSAFGVKSGSLDEIFVKVWVEDLPNEVVVYFLVVAAATAYRFADGALDRKWRSASAADPLDGCDPEMSGDAPDRQGGESAPAGAPEPRFLETIPIKQNGRIILLDVDEIVQISSYGNYLKVYSAATRFVHRETMNSIEKKLDPDRFVRIRRSAIVQRSKVRELRPISNSEYQVVLKNGDIVHSTRHYRKNVEKLLR